MKRILVDTNTILNAFLEERIINKEAKQLFLHIEQGIIIGIVPSIVFFELEWVLRSFYKKNKPYILELLTSLVSDEHIEVDQKILIEQTLSLFTHSTVSFVDCYILSVGKEMNVDDMATSDKKLKTIFLLNNPSKG